MDDCSQQIIDEIPEALTIAEESPWTNEVVSTQAAIIEDGKGKYNRYVAAVATARQGYGSALWVWSDNMVCESMLNMLQQMKSYTFEVIGQLSNSEEMVDVANRTKDKRLVVVTFGIILQVLAEAGLTGDRMRQWQRELVVYICFFFASIANGNITEFDSTAYYPMFLPSPLVMLPTGSGKSFAGIMACLCSMIRTDGRDVTLLHPRNGKALWCVPTRTLARDISGTLANIVAQQSFRQLAPSNVGKKIVSAYVTIGCGAVSPSVREKMFCVMTYEYARTQLLNGVFQDPGLE